MEGKGNWDEGTSGVVKTRRKVFLTEGTIGVVEVVKMWRGNWVHGTGVREGEGTSGVVKTCNCRPIRRVFLSEGTIGVVKMWKGLRVGSPEAAGSITIRQGLASPNVSSQNI